MTTYLTEEFFGLLLHYSEGRASKDEYEKAVAGTTQQMEASRAGFESDFPEGGPEMSSNLREDLRKGLDDYLAGLARLQPDTPVQTIKNLIPELQQAVKAIRSAQQEHERLLSEGPTLLPFINRFLLHYEAARGGYDSTGLRKILDDYPTFLQWMTRELERRDVDPSVGQIVFQFRQFMGSVKEALEVGGELPAVHEDIVEIGSALADALLIEPHSQVDGPTPIAAINRLFEALGQATGDEEELGYFLSIIGQCRQYLRTVCPTRSDPELFQALGSILSRLDHMERCLEGGEGYDALVACAEGLEVDAQRLSSLVEAVSQREAWSSELYEQHTSDLPVFFQSHLLPAYQFVEGQADADAVVEAAEHLEASMAFYQSLLEQAEEGEGRESLEQALALIGEVAKLLRTFSEQGEQALLTFASGASRQATQLLTDAGVPIR